MDDRLTRSFSATLQVSDMPHEELRWLAEKVGVPATMEILQRFAGMPLYLPRGAVDGLKKAYVRHAFDGGNTRELARMLGLTERTIFKWANESMPSKTVREDAIQMGFL